MRRIVMNFLMLTMILFCQSCEEPYIPSTLESQQEYVVEGYIEAGDSQLPPYVILTRSIPYISTIDPEQFANFFVHGAKVKVDDGSKVVQLTELCLNDLPDALKDQVYEVLGFNPDSTTANICVYADILGQIIREEGRTYHLNIHAGDDLITSVTTIPHGVGFNGFEWVDPPGVPRDTLAQLNAYITDPAGVANYYRLFTATGKNRSFVASPFGSVTDDVLAEGETFLIPIQRNQRRGTEFNPETFGLFERGDSAFVKLCTIDKAHFDFWNTRDFAARNSGPFSSYTRITSNINGGLGIWGGYAVRIHRLYCPPK
ncbi:MAG: DUF4249 domain-containing protein [Saprospiraceae bacterium]|nr:MAG: hypothetical protein UZ09_BCD002000157 [Bacteroidetes bacterium OLB9]MCO6462844.1 DUF4249 domain-containing protein [Saprospiraceae bacterium]MCZ2337646.1 DUF4249 domain-containing protein [Chitinophagales bacterium]